MSLIEKFGHYRTGHIEVDAAHFEMFALLYLAKYIKNKQILKELIATFKDLWKVDTDLEEKLMQEMSYPYMAHHINDHAKMNLRINHIISRPITTDTYYVLMDLLNELLIHFEAHDKKLIPFLEALKTK